MLKRVYEITLPIQKSENDTVYNMVKTSSNPKHIGIGNNNTTCYSFDEHIKTSNFWQWYCRLKRL